MKLVPVEVINGKVSLTIQELNELLEQSYQEGRNDVAHSYLSYNPVWSPTRRGLGDIPTVHSISYDNE